MIKTPRFWAYRNGTNIIPALQSLILSHEVIQSREWTVHSNCLINTLWDVCPTDCASGIDHPVEWPAQVHSKCMLILAHSPTVPLHRGRKVMGEQWLLQAWAGSNVVKQSKQCKNALTLKFRAKNMLLFFFKKKRFCFCSHRK